MIFVKVEGYVMVEGAGEAQVRSGMVGLLLLRKTPLPQVSMQLVSELDL